MKTYIKPESTVQNLEADSLMALSKKNQVGGTQLTREWTPGGWNSDDWSGADDDAE